MGNKKQQNMDKINRISRPLGLTLLANQVNKTRILNINLISQQDIERILNYLLSSQLTINNQPLSLQALANYLSLPFQTIMKAFLKMQEKSANIMLPGDKGSKTGAIIFLSLQKILESQSQISQQRSLLVQAQQGKYVPFLTNSVNDILKTEMHSNSYLLDLAKALSGLNGPNAQSPSGPNQTQMGTSSAIKSVGVNEALKIMQDEGILDLTYNPNDYIGIEKANKLIGLPEVRANHQIGNIEDAKYMEVKDNKAHHRTRRVIDESIDEEDNV